MLIMYLLSSSNIVIRAGPLGLTPLGNVLGIILRVNSSLFSSITSLIIGTSNDTLVSPAGTVTSYGPES